MSDLHAAEREKFEAWAKRTAFDLTRFDDADYESEYTELETESAWEAWQARAALSALAVPQWVPVSERLPEKCVEVLIFFAGQCSIAATGQYTGSKHDIGGWCYPAENRDMVDEDKDPLVTHWMPLPADPSAKETQI